MGIVSIIYSNSGMGKSTSISHFNKDEVKIIKVIEKPLPFRQNGYDISLCQTVESILTEVRKTDKDIIVIDDVTYLSINKFMDTIDQKGFEKFNKIGQDMWLLFNNLIYNTPTNKRIYTIFQEDTTEEISKLRSIGKMVENVCCIEGLVTIVLRSAIRNRQYIFETRNNGHTIVKTPIGLFDKDFIDNDLKLVDDTIKEYYNISTSKTEKQNSIQDNTQDNIQDNIQESTQDNKQETKLKRRPPRNKGEMFLGDVTKGENIPFDEI